jgi:hypothetical protein
VNANGETFEDRPPPGEYKACPLHGCRYKLYVGPPDLSYSAHTVEWVPGVTVPDLVQEVVRRELERQERLIKAHLRSHSQIDFYRTREHIMAEARFQAERIMSLADRVFQATATQEQTEGGG